MKAFASQADLKVKKTTFAELAEGVYCLTAEGDPNSGVIIGDDSVMVVEAQATPRLAGKVIEKVRSVTDKPITHLVSAVAKTVQRKTLQAARSLGDNPMETGQLVWEKKHTPLYRGTKDVCLQPIKPN